MSFDRTSRVWRRSTGVTCFAVAALLGACRDEAPVVPLTRSGAATSAPPTLAPTAPATNPGKPADLTAPTAGATLLAPGIQWRKEQAGTSAVRPEAGDTVSLHRIVWDADGAVLLSTWAAGAPAKVPFLSLPVSERAALVDMAPAERAVLWVAAGVDEGTAEPTTHLVELLDVAPGKRMPRLEGVSATPPAGARRLGTGLTCVDVRVGTGRRQPRADSRVRTEVDCFTPDGRFHDGASRGNGPSEGALGGHSPATRRVFGSMTAGQILRCWTEPGLDPGLGRAAAGPLICDYTLHGVDDAR